MRHACLWLLLLLFFLIYLYFLFRSHKSKASPASPASLSAHWAGPRPFGHIPAVTTFPSCINSHFYVSALDFTLAAAAADCCCCCCCWLSPECYIKICARILLLISYFRCMYKFIALYTFCSVQGIYKMKWSKENWVDQIILYRADV